MTTILSKLCTFGFVNRIRYCHEESYYAQSDSQGGRTRGEVMMSTIDLFVIVQSAGIFLVTES